MGERHKTEPGQEQQDQRRHARIAGTAQAKISAKMDGVKHLVTGGDPQQHATQLHHLGGARVAGGDKHRHEPGPADGKHQAEHAHVANGDGGGGIADAIGPVAIARAYRLPDQRGGGDGHAHRRHVGHRGEHHDDLRCRAIDWAQRHQHQLEQRKAGDICGWRQAHREAKLEQSCDARPVGLPGRPRAELRAHVP